MGIGGSCLHRGSVGAARHEITPQVVSEGERRFRNMLAAVRKGQTGVA